MNSIRKTDIVLVVDDSPDALSLINDALENEGLDVLVALEGRQALTIAKRIRPDVILLDALMPVMDGFETCRKLKEDPGLSDIPVIFMTGLSDSDDIVRGLSVGGVDYLVKPINPSELIARMKVHLSNARLTNSAQAALDSTGQHLFTLNEKGEIPWATPQTFALLAKAKVEVSLANSIFQKSILEWRASCSEAEINFVVTAVSYPLSVKFLGLNGDGEWLFKLIDGTLPIESALLKRALDLTERESEVLFWIANGKTNREAAEILAMSPRTVNKHLEMIFPKLGVENRTAAAGVALRVLTHEHT